MHQWSVVGMKLGSLMGFAGIFKPQALSSCLEKRFGIQSNTPETNIRMWYPRRMVRWLLPRRDVMRKIIYIYIFCHLRD